MKVVFGGACITSGTGKIGGTVIQGGPYGPIARINFKPKNRNANNQFQPCEKEIFASVAKSWRSLNPTQITAWNAAVTPPLSGYSFYLQINLQFFRINGSFLLIPPSFVVAPSSIVLSSASLDFASNYELIANFTASTNPNTLHLFVSNNNPLGQTKIVKSRLRLVSSMVAIAGVHTYIFNPTLFGVTARNGMSSFIGVRLFDSVTGQLSLMQSIQFNT
jgi:hypothetical protein